MEGHPRPDYIAPTELAAALRSPSGAPPVIVDVRDVDFAGGHIRSAINVPEFKFRDDSTVDELVQRLQNADQVVFHCMLSQVRGPLCAKRFLYRMHAVLEEGDKKPAVKVLVGGYSRFSELYKGEDDLLED